MHIRFSKVITERRLRLPDDGPWPYDTRYGPARLCDQGLIRLRAICPARPRSNGARRRGATCPAVRRGWPRGQIKSAIYINDFRYNGRGDFRLFGPGIFGSVTTLPPPPAPGAPSSRLSRPPDPQPLSSSSRAINCVKRPTSSIPFMLRDAAARGALRASVPGREAGIMNLRDRVLEPGDGPSPPPAAEG